MNKQAQSHRGELADIAGMKNFIRWRWNYDDDTKDLRFNQPGDIEFDGYYDKKQEDPNTRRRLLMIYEYQTADNES